MRLFKNKILIPICLVGLLTGYAAAERLIPRYFQPEMESIPLTSQNLMTFLGAQPTYYRPTAAGNYLAGQYAQRHKDLEKASNYLSRVLEKDASNLSLQKHAMVLAMEAGHVNKALSLAKKIHEKEKDNLLATIFLSLEDFETENYLNVSQTLSTINESSVAAFIVPVLKLWAETAQGKLNIAGLPANPFYAYHAMLAGRYINKEPEATIYALKSFKADSKDVRNIEKAADILAKSGETKRAIELYQEIKKKGLGTETIDKKIIFLQEEKSIETLLDFEKIKDPKQGAALVFLNMAEILIREYSDDSAILFSQMALYLDPTLEKGEIIIANIMARHDQPESAISYFEKVKSKSKFYKESQRNIADLYDVQEKTEEAIVILNRLYKEDGDVDALIQIGDMHRGEENYKQAVDTYTQAIKTWENVPKDYWHIFYARGMAYERLKEFEKSEADLKTALKFKPNHPYLLNYLGYSWADQGRHLNKSLDMIKRATELEPQDGYIADSLGWVYYKMNDFTEALPHLERAVELLPYDATINDHLGDVYWHKGRTLEARFQWQRAINHSDENEAGLKEKIEQKLLTGLKALPKTKTMTGAVKPKTKSIKKPAL